MREFKFRCWDKKEKEMILDEDLDYIEDFKIISKIIMQFTGLKDKNGKEIYEGDIVKIYSNDVYSFGRVDCGTILVKFGSSEDWNNIGFNLYNKGIFKIVGNKFENKELLK